jgi:hypothetical protein
MIEDKEASERVVPPKVPQSSRTLGVMRASHPRAGTRSK